MTLFVTVSIDPFLGGNCASGELRHCKTLTEKKLISVDQDAKLLLDEVDIGLQVKLALARVDHDVASVGSVPLAVLNGHVSTGDQPRPGLFDADRFHPSRSFGSPAALTASTNGHQSGRAFSKNDRTSFRLTILHDWNSDNAVGCP